MSIIHEALKKAQLSQPENKIHISKAPLTTENPSANNSVFWSCIILILCLATFYNLYQYVHRVNEIAATKFHDTKLTIASSTITPLPVPIAVVKTLKPPQPQKGEIILSGIVEMDKKSFALINNEFYETGEMVQGAKITKITTDSIEILQKGQARTIKVLRPE